MTEDNNLVVGVQNKGMRKEEKKGKGKGKERDGERREREGGNDKKNKTTPRSGRRREAAAVAKRPPRAAAPAERKNPKLKLAPGRGNFGFLRAAGEKAREKNENF